MVDGLSTRRTRRSAPRTNGAAGSGRWLSPEQERQLQQRLLEHPPEAEGPRGALDAQGRARLGRKRLRLQLPIRTIGLYLERWGWTPQRPTRKSYRQKPEDVEYPNIKARAKAEGAEIHWGDETGVEADAQRGRGYAPPGRTPERPMTG
ncbi:MAG: winged helix-turn-helix domain-containing protein [Gemmataceae bacterium]|nr:winged helix-turn-helix domain-containing protein [Gemmataceae bacterium]